MSLCCPSVDPRRRDHSSRRYEVEGPWNLHDPVHETITVLALKRAGLLDAPASYDAPDAWEYMRGLIWNDDPAGLLFDDSGTTTSDFSSGVMFAWSFKRFERLARKGRVFGVRDPLLARSHFGDLQFLHAMRPANSTSVETLGQILAWCAFCWQVSLGRISDSTRVDKIGDFGVGQCFPGQGTLRQLFGVGRLGDTRRRALGSLMHVVQDSFAKGHVERQPVDGNRYGSIREFFDYVGQDHTEHARFDRFQGGATDEERVNGVPGGGLAVEACVALLELHARSASCDELLKLLQEQLLMLEKPAEASGPTIGLGRPQPNEAEPTDLGVTFRAGEVTCPVRDHARLSEMYQRWSSTVRGRTRWNDQRELRRLLEEEASTDLRGLGVSTADASRIATAGLVGVSIPARVDGSSTDPARAFPWEYFLAAATRSLRGDRNLIVVRTTSQDGPAPKLPRKTPSRAGNPAPERVLFIESGPGPLAELYSYEKEYRLVVAGLSGISPGQAPRTTAFQFGPFEVHWLKDPTRVEIEKHVREFRPSIVHLAGIDAHQGWALMDAEARAGYATSQLQGGSVDDVEESLPDGYWIKAEGGGLELLVANDLADLVASHRPSIVTLNFFNSSAELAARIVQRGAGAAIGFHGEVDDGLAESLMAEFYRAWRLSNRQVDVAFQAGWRRIQSLGRDLDGLNVALWLARVPSESRAQEVDRVLGELAGDRRAAKTGATEVTLASGAIDVNIKVRPRLNYSLLHNGRGLFERFWLIRLRDETIDNVTVRVVLNAGSGYEPYVSTFRVSKPLEDLAEHIRVPLTSDLGRSIREALKTTVTVEVSVDGHHIYQQTHAVVLLPIDEWKDDDVDGVWLPSFIFPRDPAVAKVIDSAKRYLIAVCDDPGVGFDGYQRQGTHGDKAVDLQVQALWSTLCLDYAPGYINPPPTYTFSSQRLRMPTSVLEGRRGTCIDLALLIAACLEYIDIYPAILLFKGHAQVAYWRTVRAYQKFRTSTGIDSADGLDIGQSFRWRVGSKQYDDVIQHVASRNLVPLESTLLTRRGSFAQAVAGGLATLDPGRPMEFDSLIDIKSARDSDVTPLPLKTLI